MANLDNFLYNFPYPASYLASAHKDSSEGASANKKNCHPWPIPSLLILDTCMRVLLGSQVQRSNSIEKLLSGLD